MKKYFRMLALSVILMLAMCVTASATPTPHVMVNGVLVEFPDAVPQNIDGRVYIPMRAVFNLLGFADSNITWDGPTRTATAVKDGLTIKLTEGKKEVSVTQNGVTTVLENLRR